LKVSGRVVELPQVWWDIIWLYDYLSEFVVKHLLPSELRKSVGQKVFDSITLSDFQGLDMIKGQSWVLLNDYWRTFRVKEAAIHPVSFIQIAVKDSKQFFPFISATIICCALPTAKQSLELGSECISLSRNRIVNYFLWSNVPFSHNSGRRHRPMPSFHLINLSRKFATHITA